MSLSPLNHPKGLIICFGTELWERFSYYGMRALLIYYLTQHFLFSDEQSYAIYGAYTALAWGLPVIGGILADRYLGSRKKVTVRVHIAFSWKHVRSACVCIYHWIRDLDAKAIGPREL